MVLSSSQEAMLKSYGRSFLGAAIALYLTGETDLYKYLYSFVAAVAPVVIRYFDKNDLAFGKISGKASVDDVATEVVKAVKKAVKKTSAKKAPAKKTTAKKTGTSKK